MNNLLSGLEAQAVKWMYEYTPAMAASVLAFMIALCFGIRDGETLQKTLTGAFICGLFAVAVSSSLEYLGMPGNSVTFVGSAIGFIGADRIRGWMNNIFDRKTKDQ
ncbi:phage holin, lambda family [Entomohabitans teleogrylli]|uniref:phage holin, lambda family n=1 Tax=Entomohabitans teleogrylli TaxID=1384589 RepID=UPI00073D8F0E|nr:phage holin, lambda family [Entomohabitans teleogrylli]